MEEEGVFPMGTSESIISHLNDSLSIRKFFTRNGERLEIKTGDKDSIRVDALGLESLSWQDSTSLSNYLDLPEQETPPVSDVENNEVEREELFEIKNEYAVVKIAKVSGNAQEFLEIEAPKMGTKNQLSTTILRNISAQDMDFFSQLLRHPHRPSH